MSELHWPWLEFAIVAPLAGAIWVRQLRDPETVKKHTIVLCTLVLLSTICAWIDFGALHATEAHDPGYLVSKIGGTSLFVIDELNAPLIPLAALLYLLTAVATLRTKMRRFSFAGNLVSEGLLLATFGSKASWPLVILLIAGTLPQYLELRMRGKPSRVFALHMALFSGLLAAGWALFDPENFGSVLSCLALVLVSGAVLVRSGIIPLHCWMTDLFEHASFGSALLFVTPMVGAYAAMRLVFPYAPGWILECIGMASVVTAVYAAGMALVQREARRFFCYLFLSHSAVVLVGLDVATPVGLTGALCVWLSVGLSLAGFGLTLRSLESRTGRLSLVGFHGMYDHTPTLAAFFLLTGLASVGFPGTLGFIGTELLLDGTVSAYPLVGAAVVLAAALNGIAVLHAYFRLFTGTRHRASISLRSRTPERVAVAMLTLLILGGGLFPQPGIKSRYQAATILFKDRDRLSEQRAAVTHRKPLNQPSAQTLTEIH